jgi:hypothetical protein
MDLGTIHRNLTQNRYRSLTDFQDDVELVWSNCEKFNPPDTPYECAAREARQLFQKYMAKLAEDPEQEWLRRLMKVSSELKDVSKKLSRAVKKEAKQKETAAPPLS